MWEVCVEIVIKGLQEARERGYSESYAEEYAKGYAKETFRFAKSLLADDAPLEFVAKHAKLDLETVKILHSEVTSK